MVAMIAALSAGVLAISTPTVASDDIYMVAVSDALESRDFDRLDKSIHYYFGSSSHPSVDRTFGEYVTNQKTNALGKTDARACHWVFLSAMLELEKRAHNLGANAVININSYYKKEIVSNPDEVECHTGFLIAGIALKGTFVKVR
jgi:uncharacterized protein YbjQ (UPF0145 family)